VIVNAREWKRICCPVDFSGPSRDAVQVAADLSRRFDSELHLLHVFQVPVYSFLDATVFPTTKMVEQLLERIDSLLAHWEQEAEQLGARKVSSAKTEGIPHVEIVRFARESNCELIVMGTHGHTGVKHALIGSVAEKVVRTADCPVLTIRPLAS
jgi:nucleotide-binding universal stress UspA family protein